MELITNNEEEKKEDPVKEKLKVNGRPFDFSSMASMVKSNLGKWLDQRKRKKKGGKKSGAMKRKSRLVS